ncbi:MAG: dihydroxyacetone kinase subunit DhaL [Chloroflexota bacterium]
MDKACLNGSDVVKMMQQAAADIKAQEAYLSDLDQALGDGDHGHNIAAGFQLLTVQLEPLVDQTPAEILKIAGRTLQNEMGGASGSIFGSFFKGCAKGVIDLEVLEVEHLPQLLESGLALVEKRGKAVAGDKTLVDSLIPALVAAHSAANEPNSLVTTLQKIALAAQQGAEATAEMEAKKGRAKFLGARSIGHQDAGATSMSIILTAWAKAVREV